MPETIEAQPDAPTDAQNIEVEYLSPDEAARRLGVAAKTIRAHVASGKLRGIRLGRLLRVEWPPQTS